jgi:hypothetical protein
MRKIEIIPIVIFLVLFSFSGYSQTEVHVSPGIGTLNDAIAANGSATYILEAGKWYGLNAALQITSGVSIIGETPDEGEMPAIIQNGATSAGVTFPFMFTLTSDLTLKNVFIVDSDLNEGLGAGVIFQAASGRIVIDSVTVDPVGVNFFLFVNALNVSTYITNSVFLRQGNTLSINDGGVLWNQGGPWDTLYVENNTFVDIGTNWLLSPGQPNFDRAKFHWINHNSFLFGKANFYGLYYPDNLFFSNNLCWMYDNYLFKAGGNETWDPGNGNKYQAFFDADTLVIDTTDDGKEVLEAMPSQRKAYVCYNSNFRTQGIWDLIAWDKANGTDSYLKPFIFPEEYADSCRATHMYFDDESFPYFVTANNIEDFTEEIPGNNPNFVDQKIYELTDSAEAWAEVDLYFVRGVQGLPASSEWANYFYSTDGNNGDPTTWPRFNGAYTNEKLKTASIEKLPLGDLNWFPEQKALWEANKDMIMQHIMEVKTDQLTLTSVKLTDNLVPAEYELKQNYPNPFNPSTKIQYSVKSRGFVTLKVFNLIGQEVATLVNGELEAGNYNVDFNAAGLASGVYLYKLNAGSSVLSKKMMLLQ